jgi:O-methyltransferase domain
MDPQRLAELLYGFIPVQLIHVMARLRLAEHLADGPLTVDELSAASDAQPGMLRRLVRGLAGVGLVGVEPGERVSLKPMGALLDGRAADSMRAVALHRGGEAFAAWGKLEHAVRTGEPAFEAAHGAPFFTHLRNHPEAGAAFDGAMEGLSRGVVDEAIAHYDFGAATRVLDVGGGRGHFAAAVRDAHPHLEAAVFDVPEVADAVREELGGKQVAAIGGDFLEAVPAGYDLHILKWILHDWNDEACRRILAACRDALPEHGRIAIVERLLPDAVPDSLHPAVVLDLIMLVNFADARERRLDEYEQLLDDSGLRLERVVPLPSGFSVLSARRRS